VLAVFQIFKLNDHQMASVATVIAFLPTLLEVFSALLANGEQYAATDEPEQKL
jgi:hypothetical protein